MNKIIVVALTLIALLGCANTIEMYQKVDGVLDARCGHYSSDTKKHQL